MAFPKALYPRNAALSLASTMAMMESVPMEKPNGEQKILTEAPLASRMVKCDVCGRHYSQRYLSSHKRLSHDKNRSVATDESKTVETILALYRQISSEAKRDLLQRLSEAAD